MKSPSWDIECPACGSVLTSEEYALHFLGPDLGSDLDARPLVPWVCAQCGEVSVIHWTRRWVGHVPEADMPLLEAKLDAEAYQALVRYRDMIRACLRRAVAAPGN